MPAASDAVSALRGIGAGTTCVQYSQAYRSGLATDFSFFSWAQGFMGGWNTARVSAKQRVVDLGKMDQEQQRQFLHSYCDEHPTADFLSAVLALFKKQANEQGIQL